MDKSKFTRDPELDAEGFPRTNEDRNHQVNYLMELRRHGPNWDAIRSELGEYQKLLSQLPDYEVLSVVQDIGQTWQAMMERKFGGFTVH